MSHNAIGKRQANVVNLPNETESREKREMDEATGHPVGKCWGHCCLESPREVNSIGIGIDITSVPNVITITSIGGTE